MKTNNVTIQMGKPITAPVLIPVLHASTPNCINEPFMVNGKSYKVTCVSFGTPHGAVLVDDVDSIDVDSLGSALGTHVLFPKGASIVFVQVLDGENLKARLWQHGEGELTFSPEAACVAATTAIMLQKTIKSTVNISMNGNILSVKWDRGANEINLTGPADLIWPKPLIYYWNCGLSNKAAG